MGSLTILTTDFFSLIHDKSMELDIQKYASDLWDRWLEDPANIEFKQLFYDERIGDKGRMLLTSHVSKII